MDLYQLYKTLAFKIDAERIHDSSLSLMNIFPFVASSFQQQNADAKLGLNVSGLDWSFPVGLAAGLDKNAIALDFFSKLYFGAIEVGTVTVKAQEGNPKPRLFRLEQEKSILNRMGFNNRGADFVFNNLSKYKCKAQRKLIGVNLGKNKETAQDKALEDYCNLYTKFYSIADYLVINISSPNTQGLRDLQQKSFLRDLDSELNKLAGAERPPLYIKISPDLEHNDLKELIECIKETSFSGIIATNTTIQKERGEGGVSGQLLSSKAREIRQKCLEIMREDSQKEVIGVGGISHYRDLVDFWRHGGNVVQIYSSFIYQGPKILEKIYQSIISDIDQYQVSSLKELISFYRNQR